MLYLISSSHYIKIGYSSDINKRISQYTTCNPDYRILDTYKEGTKKDESNLHNILSEYTYRGEWMYYNDQIIKVWNDYTNHFVNTLPEIEKSECEKYIEEMTNRMLDAEWERDIARYQKYFIVNNLKNMYEQNKSKIIKYVEQIILEDEQEEKEQKGHEERLDDHEDRIRALEQKLKEKDKKLELQQELLKQYQSENKTTYTL